MYEWSFGLLTLRSSGKVILTIVLVKPCFIWNDIIVTPKFHLYFKGYRSLCKWATLDVYGVNALVLEKLKQSITFAWFFLLFWHKIQKSKVNLTKVTPKVYPVSISTDEKNAFAYIIVLRWLYLYCNCFV